MTSTDTNIDLSDLRVARPDLTYNDPSHDRWAAGHGTTGTDSDYRWHRYATVNVVDEVSTSLTGITRIATTGNLFRDVMSRCGTANANVTYDNYTDGEFICPVCALLESAPIVTVPVADVVPVRFDYSGSFAMGTTGTVTIGRNAVRSYRYDTPFNWETVTVADVLAYWQDRHSAYWQDLTFIGRTLRASARMRGWERFYDRYMAETTYDLPTVVRSTVERRTEMETRTTHIGNVTGHRPVTPPVSVYLLGETVGMSDLLATVVDLETDHERALETLAELFERAAREQAWCHEYEQTVSELNDGLSPYGGSPFTDRERDYTVTGTATITIVVPWSTTVTANDEDHANDLALEDLDIGEYVYGERVSNYDYSVDSVDVDEVNES